MAQDEQQEKEPPTTPSKRHLSPFRLGAYSAAGCLGILYGVLENTVPNWLSHLGFMRAGIVAGTLLIAGGCIGQLVGWLLGSKSPPQP